MRSSVDLVVWLGCSWRYEMSEQTLFERTVEHVDVEKVVQLPTASVTRLPDGQTNKDD
jgi:hypothetical protein